MWPSRPPYQGSDTGTVPVLCKEGWSPPTELPQLTGIFSLSTLSEADSCIPCHREPASCHHPHLHSCPLQAGLLEDLSVGICFLSLQRGWVPWLSLSGPCSVLSKTSPVIPEGGPERKPSLTVKDCLHIPRQLVKGMGFGGKGPASGPGEVLGGCWSAPTNRLLLKMKDMGDS